MYKTSPHTQWLKTRSIYLVHYRLVILAELSKFFLDIWYKLSLLSHYLMKVISCITFNMKIYWWSDLHFFSDLSCFFFFLTPRSLCSSHTHLLDAVLKHGRHWLFILPRIFFLQIFSWLTLTLFKPLLKCLNEAYSDYGNLHLPSFYSPFYILKKHFNLLTYYIILVCLLTYKNPTKKILRTGIFVLFTDISPVSVTVSTE